MSAIAQCLSHSPVVHLRPLDAERQAVYEGVLENARSALKAFAPDVVVVFGPDHYNGFFYDLMPPFCIGVEATGIGDYETMKGPLSLDSGTAAELHRHMLASGFDPAVSYDMHIDHGFTQCLAQLFETPPAFVPVFVNCAAQPVAPCSRVIAFGRAVGELFKARGQRVAFLGSGGLSHDAPLPSLDAVEGDARRKMIEFRLLLPEERTFREKRTLAAADQFATGDSPLARLNPEWDQEMMRRLAAADWGFLSAQPDADITAAAGRSAHELRTWIAAVSALSAYGPFEAEQSTYMAVPEWIVGYGALRARPSA